MGHGHMVPLFFLFAICFRDRNISTNSAFHQWQKWWSFLQRIAFDEADGHLSNLFKGRLFRSLTSFDDDTHRFLLNKGAVLKFYRNVWVGLGVFLFLSRLLRYYRYTPKSFNGMSGFHIFHFAGIVIAVVFWVVTCCVHSHWNPHLVLALRWPICVYMFI